MSFKKKAFFQVVRCDQTKCGANAVTQVKSKLAFCMLSGNGCLCVIVCVCWEERGTASVETGFFGQNSLNKRLQDRRQSEHLTDGVVNSVSWCAKFANLVLLHLHDVKLLTKFLASKCYSQVLAAYCLWFRLTCSFYELCATLVKTLN